MEIFEEISKSSFTQSIELQRKKKTFDGNWNEKTRKQQDKNSLWNRKFEHLQFVSC